MFKVFNLTLPLNNFRCALLRRLNVTLSQLHPNSWAMVWAFKILCPFFNLRPSIPMFMYFFQMKLTGKINWVSLNNVSKKMFEFDSNMFHKFKDCFFKVKATNVVSDGLSLMYEENREPHSPFTGNWTSQGSSPSKSV